MNTHPKIGSRIIAEQTNPHRHRKVLLILLACVLLESALAFNAVSDPSILVGDEVEYHSLALNMVKHRSYSKALAEPYEPSIFRSPGYPVFVAFTYLVSGNSFVFLRAVQFFLVFGTAFLVYLLVCQFACHVSALLAGIMCATYFPLVFSANHYLTETLTTFLAVLFTLLFLKYRELRSRWIALTFGVTAGFLALVRPSFALLIFAIFLIVMFDSSFSRSSRARLVCFGLVGYALCMAPWTIRNALVSNEFIPLGGAKGPSLFLSAQQYEGEHTYRMPVWEWARFIDGTLSRTRRAELATSQEPDSPISPTVRQELLVDQIYTADALEKFQTMPLRRYALSFPERMVYLWSTCDTSLGALGGAFHRIVQLQYLFTVLVSLLGFWISRRQMRTLWPLLIVPVYVTVLHTVFHVEPRYSLPARPFLIVYGAIFLTFFLSKIRTTPNLWEARRRLVS